MFWPLLPSALPMTAAKGAALHTSQVSTVKQCDYFGCRPLHALLLRPAGLRHGVRPGLLAVGGAHGMERAAALHV